MSNSTWVRPPYQNSRYLWVVEVWLLTDKKAQPNITKFATEQEANTYIEDEEWKP